MLISQVGVWGGGDWLEPQRRAELIDLAREVEGLGFSSLWISAGFGDGVPAAFGEILAATQTLIVAPGILSIWHSSVEQTAQVTADFARRFPGRFYAGLGASHDRFVTTQAYQTPYSQMCRYLDQLDDAGMPPQDRILAALGPRMIALAGERSAGAHPYLVPVEHTAQARAILGPQPQLIPELGVVLETDPAVARHIAREFLSLYLALPNYLTNLARLGFAERDVVDGGSDRLVDAVIAWGDAPAVVERIGAHLAAGASSVLVQVLTGRAEFPGTQLRALARELGGG